MLSSSNQRYVNGLMIHAKAKEKIEFRSQQLVFSVVLVSSYKVKCSKIKCVIEKSRDDAQVHSYRGSNVSQDKDLWLILTQKKHNIST